MKRTATLAALLVVVSLALGGLVALANGVPWAPSTGSASPDGSLTCSVKASCDGGEVGVFRMSSLANAKAGTPGGSSYTNVVCCGDVTGLGTSCSGTYDTVLALSDTDNAHVATTAGGAYTTEVCLSVPSGPIDCTHAATCPDGYACLATISGTTNAHVADCVTDPYATKVCCSDAAPVDCPDPGSVPWNTPAGDADCDGFPSTVAVGMYGAEADIGTDPNDGCANTTDPNDEADDRWPPDWDDTQRVNLLDLLPFKPHFNATYPDPLYEVRYDLNTDNAINLLDMLPFKPFFNLSCTP
jgi:hypothetical protein